MNDSAPQPQPEPSTRLRVVFLCYGNACRSQMAESFAARDAADWLDAASAGVSPLGYIPAEVELVMNEVGCTTEGQSSKSLSEAQRAQAADVIVDLADVLPTRLAEQQVVRRPVVDPFGGDLDDYRRTRDAIAEVLPALFEELRARAAKKSDPA